MPIRNRDDATEVEDRIELFFGADVIDRPSILRALFEEVLDFRREAGQLDLSGAHGAAGIQLPPVAERIASVGGVQVLYVALSDTDTERVRKSEVVAVAKLIRETLDEGMLEMLLLFSNKSSSQLHWIHPQFGSGATPTLRRMVVERDLPRRTVVQQISNIYWQHQDRGNILDALNDAFDVEPVTKQFFAKYKELFQAAEAQVTGFTDTEERKQFVQTLFNRLMFVYFLSRKGWLTYEGETDYLNALWRDYEADGSQTNFYDSRLYWLFFFGLNNSEGRDFNNHFEDRFMASQIGNVPFLNGGLFEETELDERHGITVPDDAIRPLMTDLFDKFNFTVMESTPFDIEVAVDPEMLGKVFEELVTGRHDSGAYYTPRPVVSFMCREALKGYLEGRLSVPASRGDKPDALARFVDDHDASDLSLSQAEQIRDALSDVTVVDPACGSGAYLVGMMQELVDLRVELYNQKLKQDARSLYELKLHIIERNLHGVDLDPFAVNIAMLRLWLSLAIEFEGDQPEPLPNLDFKIVEGDSLLGPNPSEVNQSAYLISQTDLADLKAAYLRETDPNAKSQLREEIAEQQTQLRNAMGDIVAEGGVDWRIDFAEVISKGGFDIAVANPPYIQLQKNGGKLGTLYKDCGYQTHARTGDIYQLFYERSCQLLLPKGGLLSYITSNSWLRAEYGKKTRRDFAEHHTPLRWLDLGKDVFDSAIVDSGVLLLQTGGSATPFPSIDMDTIDDKAIPPAQEHWGETRPEGDMPWSVLSKTEWSVMDKMRSRGTPLKEWDIAM